MDIADKELIAEFVVESQEGLADIERQMLALEAAGANTDVDQVNAVFRTMHSIKGAAGFLGLEQIGSLAHRLEELLNLMRNRELIPNSELVTAMLQGADCIKELLECVDDSNQRDISSHLARLAHFSPQAAPETSLDSQPSTTAESAAASSDSPISLREATREFIIECYENLEQMDRDLLSLEQDPRSTQVLRSVFRTMHTIKGGAGFLGFHSLEQLAHAAENLLGQLRDGTLVVQSKVTTVLLEAVDQCRAGLKAIESNGDASHFQPEDLIGRLQAFAEQPAKPASQPTLPKVQATPSQSTVPRESGNRAVTTPIPAPIDAAPDKSSGSLSDTTIRVDVALLDKLMTCVGELVLARNQIVQYTGRLEDAGFISTAQRLNLITTELQESVMKTRMQPIGNVWAKFPRVVRDLAGQLGKEVRIEMEGKETELDKTIVEAIKDPLTHLVRNSVDHGIEAPAARKAAGKPAEGVLFLRAYHEGGQVNIEITDDGAGLNLERIRRKSIERGLCTPDQAARMSDRDVGQLIFAAGFSTAEQVTSVSGRGVGMDVVKTNIERIGGVIDLQSKPGQGTTIQIKIPLTLAIIPALIVTCQGDRYAIPQISLLELVRLEGDDAVRGIEYMHGAPVYRLRGKLLPLVYLSERLGLTTAPNGCSSSGNEHEAVNIVVLRADDRQFGLIVDKVCDTEEIVVKPLGKQLKKIGEYAGATIMGDGGVALILDVKGLAVASGLSAEMRSHGGVEESKEPQRSSQERESVLLVDVGDSRRFALPISLVSRLEKIPAGIVEQANGQEVIQYRGKILPLLRLTDIVGGVATADQADELQIVVYDRHGQAFGLIVGRIVDTCEVSHRPQSTDQLPAHLLGTCVIQQRVTDVIDLQQLGQQLRSSFLQTSA